MSDPSGSFVTVGVGLALCASAFAALPSPARSQAPTPDAGQVAQLVGEVVDRRSEEPIPSAQVTIVRASDGVSAWSGTADEDGAFTTLPLPLGNYLLQVEAPPFVGVSEAVDLSVPGVLDTTVEMVGVDYQLDPVVAVARRVDRLEIGGFYGRMRQGTGSFITRADIEARQPLAPSDLLQTVPGILTQSASNGLGGGPRIYMRGRITQGDNNREPGCTPVFVMDGVPITPFQANGGYWGLDNIITPDNLEAIEVHRAPLLPPQFAGFTTCGVIMLWTRDPRGSEGGGGGWLPSWQKLLAAGSIVGLAFFMTQ